MATTTEFSTALGHGIWSIDTGYQRPQFDAAHLMVERSRAGRVAGDLSRERVLGWVDMNIELNAQGIGCGWGLWLHSSPKLRRKSISHPTRCAD